jgi:hypothetical protein
MMELRAMSPATGRSDVNISERAESASKAVFAVLRVTPSEDQSKEVDRIIEQAVINAMLEQAERCSNLAMECCSADLDLAHKVAEQMRHEYEALVANLSSMR